MKKVVMLAALCVAVQARAADVRVWTFEKDLEGWRPTNWESCKVRDGAVVGVSKYDCQLLSPPLNIQAEDYPELAVRVQSDISADGETFYCAPKGRLSDKNKVRHTLLGAPGYETYRIPLAEAPGWSGPIGRIRFDPLNPAGAHLRIDFIALMPKAGMLLINGGAEIVVEGKPFEWTASAGAMLTSERPFSGERALRMTNGGSWEPIELDLSRLGVFAITGQARRVRGAAPKVAVRFFGVDGKEMPGIEQVLDIKAGGWQPFEFRFDSPRRAASARVRFSVPKGHHVADLDDVQITQVSRGYITTPPPPAPTWQAQWIWHPQALQRDHIHAYFRHRFTLPNKPVRSAKLQVTVDDKYSLAVNGRVIQPMTEDVDGWRKPEVIDLKPVLKAGANEIAVDAMDVTSAQGVIAEGVVVFDDGEEMHLCTGVDWETALEPEGPWVKAKALGVPPCRPWGRLPCAQLGTPAQVEVKLGPMASQVRAPGKLTMSLSVTARSRVRRPVYVEAVLEQGGKAVRRAWAPDAFFADGAQSGAVERVDDWRVRLPYGASAGGLRVRFELHGATFVGGAPAAEVQVAKQTAHTELPRTELVVRNGLPRIAVNGNEIDPTQNLFVRPDDLQQRNAADSGVPIWTICLTDIGFKENGFDYADVDETIGRYLEAKPDVWLILTFSFDTRYHRWWLKAHPEAHCRLEDGGDVIGDYAGARRTLPAFASAVWRRDFGDALRRLVRHLKASPFAGRIIGFHPCSGVTWEWFHWGAQSGELVDYSDAGVADWRRWLKEKYRADAALQAAWHNPMATLLNVGVPTNQRRRNPSHGMFYDPKTQRDVLDYHRYQHDVVVDSILYFARIIKEETDRRSIVGTYYGYTMHLAECPGFCQSSGHFALRRMLDSDAIDYCMAPVAYAWREPGGAGACMTVPSSFALNGKLFWNQADLRTHWYREAKYGRPSDLRGSLQCMRREVARSLADGSAVQWYDFSHGWMFGDERLTDEAKRLLAVSETRRRAKDWPRSQYLAVIVDERQMGTFDLFRPPYGQTLIYRQRESLVRSGVPWRAYLFSDLMKHPELLEHRAFLMLNLFRLTKEQRDFLRTKLMADGRTVAFVGPVGLIDETGFSAAHSSEVLGWPMKEVGEPTVLKARLRKELAGAWRECGGMEFGCGWAYAPIVLPTRPRGAVLGTLKGSDQPAVLFEQRANAKVLWSAAPGLPPAMLRSLAATAGVTVVSRDNAAVFAGYGYIGIHARTAGPHTVRLPEPRAVRELIGGKTWPAGTREITLDLDAAETAILECGE